MNIIVKDISKFYGTGENKVTAVNCADMEIHDRDLILIIGPPGPGKSTLLHIISGLDHPRSGAVFDENPMMQLVWDIPNGMWHCYLSGLVFKVIFTFSGSAVFQKREVK